MPPNETDPEPRTPPSASPRSDVDFDPEIDVAPTAHKAEVRVDLAAALAQADEELRWAADAKPSEQQAYLQPTTVPRGLVAPTLDMSAVRVREGLDPRKAMTVRIGGGTERPVEAPPSSAAISGAAPSGSQRKPRALFVGSGVVIALLGVVVVRAALSGGAASESGVAGASSFGATQASAACGSCVAVSSSASDTSAGAVPIDTSAGAASIAPASTGAAPSATGAAPAITGPRPSLPSTVEPRATSPSPKPPSSPLPPPSTSAPAVPQVSSAVPTAEPSAAPKPTTAPATSSTGKVVTPLFKPE